MHLVRDNDDLKMNPVAYYACVLFCVAITVAWVVFLVNVIAWAVR